MVEDVGGKKGGEGGRWVRRGLGGGEDVETVAVLSLSFSLSLSLSLSVSLPPRCLSISLSLSLTRSLALRLSVSSRCVRWLRPFDDCQDLALSRVCLRLSACA
jgi:hypothetical protein